MGLSVTKILPTEAEPGGGSSHVSNVWIQLLLRVGSTALLTYVLFKYIDKLREIVDPTRKQKKLAQEKAVKIFKALGKSNVKDLRLTEYELNVASQLVVPTDIGLSWEEIGGLDDVIRQIKETVILPFQRRDLFKMSKLFQPPKGILLFGPPGCGKTMLAKATANAAGCAFLNIEVQQLTDKWYGESQKLGAAVFALARKLQPSIIFIDEIDIFLQMRSDRDHEVTAMMKATFLSLWDGLSSESDSQIMVMGATNRPQVIDQAVLRRMPIRLEVPMPNSQQRCKVLEIVLAAENLQPDVDFQELSDQLAGFSGSDIKELCRHASVTRVHEHIRNHCDRTNSNLRPIEMTDLKNSVEVLKRSKKADNPLKYFNYVSSE